MQMNYYGLSCLAITANQSSEATLILDPFENTVGLKLPRSLTADVVFTSQDGEEHGAIGNVQGTPFLVTMPGEYEVKGITVDARQAPTKKNAHHRIARVLVDDMSIGFLGAIDRELDTEELSLLEGVDVLALPVGGGDALTPKMAAAVIRQVEPRVIVPLQYAEPGLKVSLESLQAFKKELGPAPTEEVTKYKLARKQLPQDDMLLVVLSRG